MSKNSYDNEEESKGPAVEELPVPSTNVLYDMLGVQKTATQAEIKKAYRRLALLQHQDKCPDDPKANDNFLKLNKAYQVLSDEKKRARYDQYGDDGEGDAFKTDEWLDAYDYYRNLHPEITKQDYRSFSERYKGSDEEAQDLIEFYEEQNGNVTKILEFIICSTNEDLPRFLEFYETKIKEGILEKTANYEKSKKKIELLPDEKAEAKAEKQKLKAKKEKAASGNMADLEKMILAKRQNGFTSFLDNLEKKYCNEDNQLEEDEDGWVDDNKPKKRKPAAKPAQPKKQRKI